MGGKNGHVRHLKDKERARIEGKKGAPIAGHLGNWTKPVIRKEKQETHLRRITRKSGRGNF